MAFLLAKYIGLEINPTQMVSSIQSIDPFEYYKLAARKSFYNVLLIGKNEVEMERFLRILRMNNGKVECNSFVLMSNLAGKDFIIKRVTHSEVQMSSYNLNKYSTFDAIWILETNEHNLNTAIVRFGNNVPANIPRMGIIFERIYKRSDDALGVKVIFSFDDQILMDSRKCELLIKHQIDIMKTPNLGFIEEFVRQNHRPEYFKTITKMIVGMGVVGVVFYGLWKYSKDQKIK